MSGRGSYGGLYIGAWKHGIKRFPLYNDIAVPATNTVAPEQPSQEVRIPILCRIKIDPSDVTHVNLGYENDESGTVSDGGTGSTSSPSIETSIVTSYPVNPFSPAKALVSEWDDDETGQQKSISGPISVISGVDTQSSSCVTKQPLSWDNYLGRLQDADSESQKLATLSNSHKNNSPFPLQFLLNSPNSGVDDCQILPNPYNKINHKFHSALQCPCFLYFFFICCLPGIQFMEMSDLKYKKSDAIRAKKWGRLSTIFLIVGSIVGVLFLSISLFFAGQYVRQFVVSG